MFAAGNLEARIVVVGGMPAADDDREGQPFSGSAGQILGRMMAGIGPVVHGWAIGGHLGPLFVAFSIFSAFLPALWMRDPRAGTTPHGAAFSRRPSVSG